MLAAHTEQLQYDLSLNPDDIDQIQKTLKSLGFVVGVESESELGWMSPLKLYGSPSSPYFVGKRSPDKRQQGRNTVSHSAIFDEPPIKMPDLAAGALDAVDSGRATAGGCDRECNDRDGSLSIVWIYCECAHAADCQRW